MQIISQSLGAIVAMHKSSIIKLPTLLLALLLALPLLAQDSKTPPAQNNAKNSAPNSAPNSAQSKIINDLLSHSGEVRRARLEGMKSAALKGIKDIDKSEIKSAINSEIAKKDIVESELKKRRIKEGKEGLKELYRGVDTTPRAEDKRLNEAAWVESAREDSAPRLDKKDDLGYVPSPSEARRAKAQKNILQTGIDKDGRVLSPSEYEAALRKEAASKPRPKINEQKLDKDIDPSMDYLETDMLNKEVVKKRLDSPPSQTKDMAITAKTPSKTTSLEASLLRLGGHLSLKDAFALLQEGSHSLRAKNLSIDRHKKLYNATLEAWLPNISLNAAYVYFGDDLRLDVSKVKVGGFLGNTINNMLSKVPPIQFTSKNFAIGSVNLVYPLFLGGRRININRAAKLGINVARKELDASRLRSFTDLVATYYGVALNRQLLRTYKDISRASKRHLKNARALKRAGQIPKIVLMQANVAYKMSLTRIRQANTALSLANSKLKSLLDLENSNIKTDGIIPIKKRLALAPLASYIDLAMSNSPLLKSIELRRKQGKMMSRAIVGEFLPNINLFGGAEVNSNNSFISSHLLPSYNVGVGLNWNLISPTGKIGRYQASRIALLEAAALEQDARAKLRLMTRAAYKEAVYAHASYMELGATIALARENLRVNELAFSQGVSTEAAIDDARALLQGALLERSAMAYKYIVNLGALAALCGDLNIFYTQGENR